MRQRTKTLLLCTLLVAPLAFACGKKGPVLPPISLKPKPVEDLTVRQQGGELVLEAAYPKTTISGVAMPGLEAIEVWQLLRTAPDQTKLLPLDPREFGLNAKLLVTLRGAELQSAVAGDRLEIRVLLPNPLPPPVPVPVTTTAATATTATPSGVAKAPTAATPTTGMGNAPAAATAAPTAAGTAAAASTATPPPAPAAPPVPAMVWHLAIRATATGGQRSELSNVTLIAPTSTPAAPKDVTVTPKENGIEISWAPVDPSLMGVLIYRRDAQRATWGPFLHGTRVAEGNHYLDTTAQFGHRYVYSLSTMRTLSPRIESARAGEHEIDYEDRFPPAPPQHLLTLSEGRRVRLIWERSPSPDTVGYVIYRQDPEGDFHRLNSTPISALEYIDTGLVPGIEYRYRVAAIDKAGNLGEAGETAVGAPGGPR